MANLLDKAVAGVFKQTRRVSGVAVTYTRGAATLALTAIPARGEHTLNVGEVSTIFQTRDYLILAEELIFSGVATLPARGDTITEGGVTRDVLSISGSPGWEYTDQTRQLIRVHTKP